MIRQMLTYRFNMALFIGVLMFAAKPFVGFSMFEHMQSNQQCSILVKAFTQRKQEYVEDSDFDMLNIQRRLNKPAANLMLLFWGFLSLFFPVVFAEVKGAVNRLLAAIKQNLFPHRESYLLEGKLII